MFGVLLFWAITVHAEGPFPGFKPFGNYSGVDCYVQENFEINFLEISINRSQSSAIFVMSAARQGIFTIKAYRDDIFIHQMTGDAWPGKREINFSCGSRFNRLMISFWAGKY